MKTLNEIARWVGASVAEIQLMLGEQNDFEIRIGRAKTVDECFKVYDELYDKDSFKHIRDAAMRMAVEKSLTFADCIMCYEKTVYDENAKSAIDKALVLAQTPGECWKVYNLPSAYAAEGPMRADGRAIFAKMEKMTREEIEKAVKLDDYIRILETRLSHRLTGYIEMRKEVGERIHSILKRRIQRAGSFGKLREVIAITMKKGEMYHLPGRDEVITQAVHKSWPIARTVADCLELARVLRDASSPTGTLSDTSGQLMEAVMRRSLSLAKGKEEYREIIKAFGGEAQNPKLDSMRNVAYEKLRLCHERCIDNALDVRSCVDVLCSIVKDGAGTDTKMKVYDKAVSLAKSFDEYLHIRRGLVVSFEWQVANELAARVDPIILKKAKSYEDCESFVRAMEFESSFTFKHCFELITKARRKAASSLKKFIQCRSKIGVGSSKELLDRAFDLAQNTEDLRWLLWRIPKEDKSLRERIIKRILLLEGQMTFKT